MIRGQVVRRLTSHPTAGPTAPRKQWHPRVSQPWRSRYLEPSCSGLHNLAVDRKKDSIATNDTIYALSTASGRAAIAVIRVSGPACLDIYGGLCPNKPFPLARTAALRRLYDPVTAGDGTSRILDSGALVLFFPAPKTVTGEPVLELHVHGGPAIIRSILEAIPKCVDSRPRRRTAEYSFIRPAEPGEFTKRAFYNGRLDLTQAEALGEALAAETEQQRRLAVMGTESGLAKRYEDWRQMLLHARGELEALIDFSEDQHFDESPAEFMKSVTGQIVALVKRLKLHIQNAARGELLRNGINIALLGAPNAGKSSLLNRIVGREAAIVSPEAGTTRDIVDVSVDINGWLCRIGDMAGLRGAITDPNYANDGQQVGNIEREGIRRARERALQSDLVVTLLPIERDEHGHLKIDVNSEVVDAVHECHSAGKTVVYVLTKADLLGDNPDMDVIVPQLLGGLGDRLISDFNTSTSLFAVSCHPDANIGDELDSGNIQAFLEGLSATFAEMASPEGEAHSRSSAPDQSYWAASLSITHRQKAHLQECLGHLQDFLAQAKPPSSHHTDSHDDLIGDAEVDIVTAAEHLRYAAMCLAKVTGKGEGGDVEDVLGIVFEK